MEKAKLSYTVTDPSNTVTFKNNNIRIKFKMSVEIARNLKGKSVAGAIKFLNDVTKFKDIVKVTRFAKKCGRKAMATNKIVNGKRYSDNRGRWPVKPAKAFLSILSSLVASAEKKSLAPEDLTIEHVNVNQAPILHGRMQRAFGRVSASNSHPCHIELVAVKKGLVVEDLD